MKFNKSASELKTQMLKLIDDTTDPKLKATLKESLRLRLAIRSMY